MNGIKILLCLILMTLAVIAERGIPVKFKKGDMIVYPIFFITLVITSKYFL